MLTDAVLPIIGGMGLQPSLVEQELLVDTRRRAVARLVSRELLCEMVAGAGFVATVAFA